MTAASKPGLIGIDEVGRGAWAGPLLVVAARNYSDLPGDVSDSKKLSSQRRLKLLNLLSNCCSFGEGWVAAVEIDRIGLAGALKLGAQRALNELKAGHDDEVMIDGKVNFAPAEFIRTTCMIDADEHIPLVSAASIYAKVRRDSYMKRLGDIHTNYKFESHVGYGTRDHRQAIAEFGTLAGIHRLSFKPMLGLNV